MKTCKCCKKEFETHMDNDFCSGVCVLRQTQKDLDGRIDKAIRKRMFETFFSKKDDGT